jgi:hypothetical protein
MRHEPKRRTRKAQPPRRGLPIGVRILLEEVCLDWRRMPATPPNEPHRGEKAEQQSIHNMLDATRCPYWDSSQPFAPLITSGLPDIIAFNVRVTPWRIGAIEVKADGAAQSPEQRAFEEACRRSGIDYILGGAREVALWLGLETR